MEPTLIEKFKKYRRRRERKELKADFKANDSGVSAADMRSNDLWCIVFLILIIYEPRFIGCYKFPRDDQGRRSIVFDSEQFVKLLEKFLCACELDQNFSFVIKKLCNYDLFKQSRPGRPRTRNLFPGESKLQDYSVRDLKFFIWVLSYSKYPQRKIGLYEKGNRLREIDECKTLGSNESLYDTSGEEMHMESVVTFYQTDQQINEKIMRTGKVLPQIIDRIEEVDEEGRATENGESKERPGFTIEHAKQNDLNKKVGGDVSFELGKSSQAYLSDAEPVNNLPFFDKKLKKLGNRKNGVGKGILTLESENNFKYDETLLEKQLNRLKRKPKKQVFAAKVCENLLKFHKDTPKTKEFSEIKLNFGEDPKKESKKASRICEDDKLRAKMTPSSRPHREHINRVDHPIEEIPIPKLEYTSVAHPNTIMSRSLRKYRTGEKRKSKRRVSRSRSTPKSPKIPSIARLVPDLSKFDLDLINSLKKMKNRKMNKSALNEINIDDYTMFGSHNNPAPKIMHNPNKNECNCQMCLNSKKKPLRRRSTYRSRKSFDSQKSVEEIQEDKMNYRRKNSSRSVKRRREPDYADPYSKKSRKGFGPDIQVKNHLEIFGNNFGSRTRRERSLKRTQSFIDKTLGSQVTLESEQLRPQSRRVLNGRGLGEAEESAGFAEDCEPEDQAQKL